MFPCLPKSKQPAIKGGFHAATTNPATIQRYWRIADRNIGIPTGEGAGFWVLDIDGDAGEESLLLLERKHGPLPPTREVTTGNGRHVWFHCAAPLASSAGRIGSGLDVRADRAYIVCPPSVHPSGRVYSWRIPAAPLAASAGMAGPPCPRQAGADHHRAGGGEHQVTEHRSAVLTAALRSTAEVAALAAVLPGSRNHALNLASFRLFQLVAGGELDGEAVAERLVDACHRNSLIADDGLASVLATIRSGRRAGLQCPRKRRGAT